MARTALPETHTKRPVRSGWPHAPPLCGVCICWRRERDSNPRTQSESDTFVGGGRGIRTPGRKANPMHLLAEGEEFEPPDAKRIRCICWRRERDSNPRTQSESDAFVGGGRGIRTPGRKANPMHLLAEGEGFEPPEPVRAQRFSRPPVSTTHTSLRAGEVLGGKIYCTPRPARRVQPAAARTRLPWLYAVCIRHEPCLQAAVPLAPLRE